MESKERRHRPFTKDENVVCRAMLEGGREILIRAVEDGVSEEIIYEVMRSWASNLSEIHRGPPLERPKGQS